MNGTFGDTFDALLALQKALEGRLASDWLRDATSSRGPFPPINVFQQGDDFVAVVELPGVSRDNLEIQARFESPARRSYRTRRISALTDASASQANLIEP
jgi:hypothetical protein